MPEKTNVGMAITMTLKIVVNIPKITDLFTIKKSENLGAVSALPSEVRMAVIVPLIMEWHIMKV